MGGVWGDGGSQLLSWLHGEEEVKTPFQPTYKCEWFALGLGLYSSKLGSCELSDITVWHWTE